VKTLLPYSSFAGTARCLDGKRLRTQRTEGLRLLRVLVGAEPDEGWPATRMWRGHEALLSAYCFAIGMECRTRGYSDKSADEAVMLISPEEFARTVLNPTTPRWLGDEALHRSHRSYLVKQAPDVYQAMWPDVPPDLPFVWPLA